MQVEAGLSVARLLRLVVVLDVLTVVYSRTVGAELNASWPLSNQLFWIGLHALLAYRVWRGGRLAWTLLFVLKAGPALLLLALATATPSDGSFSYVAPLALAGLTQAGLLLLPRVRAHVHPSSGLGTVRVGDDASPRRSEHQARQG
ncbi:MAG: hypothetical protein R6U94_05750 [Nitriliruptoraceae bacterium]